MLQEIITKFLSDPINISIGIAIILFSLSVPLLVVVLFIRIIGNPLNTISNLFKKIIPVAIKELRFKAGRAGLIDIIISFFTFILGALILINSVFNSIYDDNSINNVNVSILIFLISIIVFIVSLQKVYEFHKLEKHFKDNKLQLPNESD